MIDPSGQEYASFRRKFSEEFLSTFAGQKIPKEGTCFDYFYDWQSDSFKDWATKVRSPTICVKFICMNQLLFIFLPPLRSRSHAVAARRGFT